MLHPTEIRRVPLTQEANVVLPPCAQPLQRTVQVLIPGGATNILFGEGVLPNEVGPNRVYKLAPMPPGTTIRFPLGPDQWLVGATSIGSEAITLIVEYSALERGYTSQRLLAPVPEPPTAANPTRELLPAPVYDAIQRRREQ